jgi:hypothetical protein
LLLLLPQWCIVLPPHGEATWHREKWIRLKRFLAGDWENLQDEFFLQAQALLASSSSIPFPQHDPPNQKRLLCSLALGRVGEYSQVAHVLAPFSLASTSSNPTLVFTTLHLELDGYFPLFFEDYKLDQDFKLSSDSFKLVIKHMSHLSTSGLFEMVFEHL